MAWLFITGFLALQDEHEMGRNLCCQADVQVHGNLDLARLRDRPAKQDVISSVMHR